eukprot:6175170-Prymnesium_polylepis.1
MNRLSKGCGLVNRPPPSYDTALRPTTGHRPAACRVFAGLAFASGLRVRCRAACRVRGWLAECSQSTRHDGSSHFIHAEASTSRAS